MSTTVRELLVSVGLDPDEKSFGRVEKGIEQIKSGLGKIVQAAGAAAAGIGAFGAGIIANARATSKHAKAIKNQSRALNTTVRQYQRLVFAAESYGAEQQEINDVLGVLSDRAEDARRGTESYAESFRLLGIQMSELKGKKPAELMKLVAERTREMRQAGETQKVLPALERLLGGDVRKKLMPLLVRGREGIEAVGDQGERLGAVLEENAINKANEFALKWEALEAIINGFRRQLAIELFPTLIDIAERFKTWIQANEDLIQQRIDQFAAKVAHWFWEAADALARVDKFALRFGGWAELLETAAKAVSSFGAAWAGLGVAQVVLGITNILIGLGSWLAGLPGIIASIAGTIASLWAQIQIILSVGLGTWLSGVAAAVGTFIVEVLAPVLAVVAALTALYLIVEDFVVFLMGGQSVIGEFVAWFREWIKTAGVFQAFLRQIGKSFKLFAGIVKGIAIPVFHVFRSVGLAVFEAIKQAGLTLWVFLKGIFNAWLAFARPMWRLIAFLGRAAFMAIAAIVKWLWNNILGPFVQTVSSWFIWLATVFSVAFQKFGKAARLALGEFFNWVSKKLDWFAGWVDWMRKSLASLFGMETGKAADKVKDAAKEVQKAKEAGDDEDDDVGKGGGPPPSSPGAAAQTAAAPKSKPKQPGMKGSLAGGPSPKGLAAGGPSPKGLAAGGTGGGSLSSTGAATKQIEVNYKDGGTTIELVQQPDESMEEFERRVRQIIEEENARKKKQVREAVVRGAEQ
ncbi:MAG: hypothetical protein ABEN55_12140 [Bradymonadaceae bacterium]